MKKNSSIQECPVAQLPIELHKLLKFLNLVMSGGEAKHVILQGMVRVNNDVELRRGRKIAEGDVVSFQGASMRIVCGEDDEIFIDPEEGEPVAPK